VSWRYRLGAAALALILLLPLRVHHDEWPWELVQLAGLLAAVCCLILTGAPLRPRVAQPATILTPARHRWIAWLTVALATLHIAGAVLADPVAVEYLKPSAPVYQLAGMACALLLLLVSISAGGNVRRWLWRNTGAFQFAHVGAAAVIVVMLTVHVIASNRYTGGWARWLWAAAAAACLASILQPRARSTSGFGGNALGTAAVVGVAIAGVLLLAALSDGLRAREMLTTVLPAHQPPPLTFPHERHVAINCIACHHNFVDRTGRDSCIPCHRSARIDLQLSAEARFHSLCMGCHRDPSNPPVPRPRGEIDFQVYTGRVRPADHGPVSRCGDCHRYGPYPARRDSQAGSG